MAKSIFEQIVDRSIVSIFENDLIGAKIIGQGAFNKCLSLKEVVMPSSIIGIDNYGFQECSELEKVVFSDNITYIYLYAFSSCSKLSSITLPAKLQMIGGSAFSSCSSLTSIRIPKGVVSMGSSCFSSSSGSMSISNAYFEQPSGMDVTLPTSGSGSGMFYVKTSRSMNVYTDNEIIKNYNWSSDNITATLYHLDGTPW